MADTKKDALAELAKCEREAGADAAQICGKIGEMIGREAAGKDSLQIGNAAAMREGKWMNGRRFEYEYAYCPECGRMKFAGLDTHKQAEKNIESFAIPKSSEEK